MSRIFAPEANRPEAWNISITESENSLWNDGIDQGGDLSLIIDVWDHHNAGLNMVNIESSTNFVSTSSSIPIGGGVGYSTYQIDIIDATPAQDSIDIFITVECEEIDYGGLLSGKTVAAYFQYTATVSPDPPPDPQGPGKLTWTSQLPGDFEIYRMQGDGTQQTRLTYSSGHDWDPAWSPDGTKIVWRRGGYGAANIMIMDEDGSNQTQVTTNGWNFDPDYGPNGDWIYFWSYNGTSGGPHIWKVRPSGADIQQVSSFGYPAAVNIGVSPANDLIAFEGGSTGGARDLWVMDIDGSNPTQLSNTGYWEAYPYFNSDGTKIVYTSNPTGTFRLYTINPDGTGMIAVTDPPTGMNDFSGCFGVDDEELFMWRRMGSLSTYDEIGRYDLNTDEFTQLTFNNAMDQQPDWHPND